MELSPAQRGAYEGVLRALSIGNIVGLWGSAGMGKTTFLTNKERCAPAEARAPAAPVTPAVVRAVPGQDARRRRAAGVGQVVMRARAVVRFLTGSRAILAVGSGVLLALALPPFNVEWLGWLALVPLLVAARERRPLEALGLGLLAGLVCGAIHVGWHENAHALHFAYLPFLWLAMLLGTVAAAACRRCAPPVPGVQVFRCSGVQGEKGLLPPEHLSAGGSLRWVAFVACAGVAAEWLTTFSPLPLNLAICQYQSPVVIQVAALTGIWGVSFLLWWSNAALAEAVSLRRRVTAPLAAAVAALALAFGYGHLALASSQGVARLGSPLLRVAAIQEHSGGETAGFVPVAAIEAGEGDRDALTRRAVASGARLVVWSEDCLGSGFAPDARSDATMAMARELKAHLVVGYSEPGPMKSYNCAAIVSPDGRVEGVHRKTHLFFGERQMREPGRDARAFDTALGRVGLEICFDNCYTDVTRRLVEAGARIIAVPNYDPPTPRGILHCLHAAVLPFRAVENRVPIVRADANGCSQIVDAAGRTIGESPLFAPDALVGDVALGDGAGTVFTRCGDVLAYVSLLVVAVASLRPAGRAGWLRRR